MSFIDTINSIGDGFESLIRSHTTDLVYIPTEDYGWTNHRWSCKQFRLAHIERFTQPKFSVLHTVIFPHTTDPSPIFGFDIVASDTKATGLFFDLSPTVNDWGEFFPNSGLSDPRERPEWGDIFSSHWIACRPTLTETKIIGDQAQTVLARYLAQLPQNQEDCEKTIIDRQNYYSLQQRKNEHTTRVLKNILGEPKASFFIDNILFPTFF